MTRQWKPGDIGVTGGDPGIADPLAFLVYERDGKPCFFYADGDSTKHPPREDARPVLIIDPEDRVQARRLLSLYEQEMSDSARGSFLGPITRPVDSMQAALRSLLTPPRPEEPQEFGSQVVDGLGAKWVRVFNAGIGGDDARWASGACRSAWADIPGPVRILSAGVTDAD